jgi:hypothetical protein
MSAQTVTIVSGVLLLVVFALVAWNLMRRRDHRGQENHTSRGKPFDRR